MINVAVMTRLATPGLRLGLVTMLTTFIVLVIVLVMVLTTLLDIRRARNVFRADQGERGLLLATTLNEVMAGMVYFADVDGLHHLTERVSRTQPDITHVQVYTATGRVLAYQRSPRYLPPPEKHHPPLMLPGEGLPSAKFGKTGLEIFSPLLLGPETVGVLNLGFDDAKLDEAIGQMVIQHIWQGAVLIAMGMILAYLIARHVTNPLKSLAEAASEFGQGNLDTPTPIQGAKEVSMLGGALESMRLELRSVYHGLESQVAQRTLELSNANDELKKESAERKNTEEQLAGLFEVSGAMGQPGSFKEKSEAVIKNVAQIAQADWVTMRIPSEEGLKLVALEGGMFQGMQPRPLSGGRETTSAQAFRSAKFIVRNDYQSHENATPDTVGLGVKSMVSLPLKASGTPVGLMNVLSSESGHFTPERVNLLVAIADGLGVLMENAHLYDELLSELNQRQQTQQDLGALFEVAGALGQPGSFKEKAQGILRKVAQIAQADWVTMRLLEEDGLRIVAVEGPAADWSPPIRSLTSKESLAFAVFESGEHIVLNDYPAHPQASAAIVEVGIRSMVLMALKVQGKPVGLMNVVSSESGHFTPERVNLLVAISDGLGVLMENANLYERLVQELDQRQRAEEALRESEGNLQALVNSAVAGIVTMDQNGMIESFNPAAERLFGYAPEEVIGRSVAMLMPLPYKNRHAGYLERYLETGEKRIIGEVRELLAQRKDGTIFSMELAVSEVDLGDRRTFTGIISDISDRKQAEEELAQRALALEAANKELDAFSYSVSHDLRAPLRSIDGFSQALLDDYSELLDKDGQEYLHRVRASSQRMAELIDDMLQLSRLTRTELSREPVDLGAIAKSIASDLQASEPQRMVTFNIADNLEAEGDPRLLRVVLENLFRNAWKFTSAYQTARIQFGVTKADADGAYFVSDDGAGFDMAYADKLFGAFQRLHSAEEFEGTGIGLATVQRIINRHGGRVWAEGQVNKGATFYFTVQS